jgi:epoxyqueuosine reductase
MNKKLLLHVCCAPCLSGSNEPIQEEGFDITGYFYNPNIHPSLELNSRIDALKKYSSAKKIDMLIYDEPGLDIYENEVAGKPGNRCFNCYSLRLNRTARVAANGSYDAFSTTISISPYQDHEQLIKAGLIAERIYGVKFHYKDLRPFYKRSIEISKEMGLYRQKYCGCYLSVPAVSRSPSVKPPRNNIQLDVK